MFVVIRSRLGGQIWILELWSIYLPRIYWMGKTQRLLAVLPVIIAGCLAAPGPPTGMPYTPTAAPPPTPTEKIPTSTTIPLTDTPEPRIIPAPSGLVYYSDNGIWLIGKDSTPQFLLEGTRYISIEFSSDGKKFLYRDSRNLWYHIVDLVGGDSSEIAGNPNYHFCNLSWWHDNPGYLIGAFQHVLDSGGMYCIAVPGIMREDGTGMFFLSDEKSLLITANEYAHAGDILAFDINGQPWIYKFGVGKEPFNVKTYDFAGPDELNFSRPSLSNDQRFLAWVVYETVEDKTTQGVAVFDMENRSSIFLHPYNVCCWEGLYTSVYWSNSDNYLAIHNPLNDTEFDLLWVVTIDGRLTYQDEGHTIGVLEWSPKADIFGYSYFERESGEKRLKIVSAIGEELADLHPASIFWWSPTGDSLILADMKNRDRTEFWLVDDGKWESLMVDLPDDAVILGWIFLD